MPELPDVEIFRQYAQATSLHQKIISVETHSGKVLKAISAAQLDSSLRGHCFAGAQRRGKYLFLPLENEQQTLVIHFGMTGFLRYAEKKGEIPGHARIVFNFKKKHALFYVCSRQLGFVTMTDSVEEYVEKLKLGPDAWSLTQKTFHDIMKKGGGALKPFLMNQKKVAGLGNIYVDEILFHARLHPAMEARKLTDRQRDDLYGTMQSVLRTAVECRADPESFPESFLLPKRKKNADCPRCGEKIEKFSVGGRSAYVCPSCQQKPRS